MLDIRPGDILELVPEGQPSEEFHWWEGTGLVLKIEDGWAYMQMFDLVKINKKNMSQTHMGARRWEAKAEALQNGGARKLA